MIPRTKVLNEFEMTECLGPPLFCINWVHTNEFALYRHFYSSKSNNRG